MSKSQTSSTPSLVSLKLVVKHDVPPDELWVHPAMFDLLQRSLPPTLDLLQRAFMESATMREFRPEGCNLMTDQITSIATNFSNQLAKKPV